MHLCSMVCEAVKDGQVCVFRLGNGNPTFDRRSTIGVGT